MLIILIFNFLFLIKIVQIDRNETCSVSHSIQYYTKHQGEASLTLNLKNMVSDYINIVKYPLLLFSLGN